ncbi:hypothetical protein FHW84_002790 [Dyella sp. SG562]|uniref:phage tail tube protein n=1 Tax=Dyella sp. SG562 TaxID=2587017 RepID=UPI00141DE4F6|nr:hypothetical protein [Dyella sp. SG562]NII74205.1 hypothetical protein [Dyella sp. SG562]
MKDFSFQGKIYLAQRGTDGKPLALAWVGDASQLQVKLSVDTDERQESYSGSRLTSVRLIKARKAEFSLTLNYFSKLNLGIALSATPVDVTSGSVTAEPTPTGLVVGDVIALDHKDVSALTITDSSATPKTLVKDVDYAEESLAGGLWRLLSVGTPTPYTQPFKNAYTHAAEVRLPAFTGPTPERYLVLDGINTVDDSRVRVRLFRCSFNPTDTLDLITDSLGTLQLSGAVLYDSTNAADSNMGGFGRIELPSET